MSRSARRLVPGVATERFAWQRGAASASVVPLLRVVDGPAPAAPASVMRDLPSPGADRIEAAERDAFARGRAEGEQAAEAASRAHVQAVLQRVADTVTDVNGLRDGMLRRSEREMVRLALAMAERVIRREVRVDRELLMAMARAAVDRLGDKAIATVHLNPADCEAVRERGGSGPGALEIVADATVPRGGCLVRSAHGNIDAGIAAQMRELAGALLGDDTAQEDPADGLPADV